jgi:hypothetical protein
MQIPGPPSLGRRQRVRSEGRAPVRRSSLGPSTLVGVLVMIHLPRRDFLRHVGAGMLGGAAVGSLGSFAPLGSLASLRAQDAKVSPELVRLEPEIEPVVKWIEETPREKILEKAADELRAGLPYRHLLAGLFLAGIRNIQPRPVGFKFHAVMVVESAHQLGLDLSDRDRWLPLFWALDNFKASQAADVREGDWVLGPVKEAAVPSAGAARRSFEDSMTAWDESAADAAVAGFARACGTGEVTEALWRYGARDWQNIGHKIIFTAHSIRTLHTIGWEHAEPVLRSLVFALLNGGEGTTSATYTSNAALAKEVRPDWVDGKPSTTATSAFLGVLRQATPEDAAREASRALASGVAASSLWDAVLLAGADLLIRQPGIVALHALTATNSLHFAFRSSGSDHTRLLVLFQACSWTCLYREAIRARGSLPDGPLIETLEAETALPATAEELFQDLGKDRALAARRALSFTATPEGSRAYLDSARRLAFTKGNDSHDYKYASALIEEAPWVSTALRPRFLAASAYQLRSASEPDSALLGRSRRALGYF